MAWNEGMTQAYKQGKEDAENGCPDASASSGYKLCYELGYKHGTPDPEKVKLRKMIAAQIKKSYAKEYQSQQTDADGLGLMVSHYFEWDGLEILKTLSIALEDANFHSENKVISEMIKKIEREAA